MVRKIATLRNLRKKTYEIIRDYIVSDEFPSGAKINENDLAKKLGVSKTPVREALSKLALEGLVEIKPNRGSFKAKLSIEDIYEIMVIRETLEGLCCRLAAKHIDDKAIARLKGILNHFDEKNLEDRIFEYPEALQKFHALIYDLSKNPWLVRIMQSMNDLTRMFRLQYFKNPQRVRRSVNAHKELIEALENRDGESAERSRKNAIRFAYEALLEKDLDKLT